MKRRPITQSTDVCRMKLARLSKADQDYLQDIASAFLSSPENRDPEVPPESDEEWLLTQAHDLACFRLGIDPVRHLDILEEGDADELPVAPSSEKPS